MTLVRRQALRGGLSLGALTLLTGCDLSDHDAVQRVLARFSAWNDKVQAALFSPQRSGADLSRGDGGEGFPLQRVVRPGEGTAPRSRRLSAATGGPDRQQAAMDRR